MSSTAGSVSSWLKLRHISVPDDWISACLEWMQSENQNTSDASVVKKMVYEQWLMTDLRDFGQPCLPAEITNDVYTLKGAYSVQIDNVLDVSQPKYSQLLQRQNKENVNTLVCAETQATQKPWEVKPTRMLMLSITDGVRDSSAMEYNPIAKLNDKIPPGTKMTIKGPVICRRGVIMLKQSNIEILGGEVEDLFSANNYEAVLCLGLNRPVPSNPTPQSSIVSTENQGQISRVSADIERQIDRGNTDNYGQISRTSNQNHGQRRIHNNQGQIRTTSTKNYDQRSTAITRHEDQTMEDEDLDKIMADVDFDDDIASSLPSFENNNISTNKKVSGRTVETITISDDELMDDFLADADLDDTPIESTSKCTTTSKHSTNLFNNDSTRESLSSNITHKVENQYQTPVVDRDSTQMKSNFTSQKSEKISPFPKQSNNFCKQEARSTQPSFSKGLEQPRSEKFITNTYKQDNRPLQDSKTSQSEEYQQSNTTKGIPGTRNEIPHQCHVTQLTAEEEMDIFEDDIPILGPRNVPNFQRKVDNNSMSKQTRPYTTNIYEKNQPRVTQADKKQNDKMPSMLTKPFITNANELDVKMRISTSNEKHNEIMKTKTRPYMTNSDNMDVKSLSQAGVDNKKSDMYLCQAKKFLLNCQGEKSLNICIKGIVITLLSKLKSDNRTGWGLKARICDGTEMLDADFSNEVLSKLIGFTVAEAEAIKLTQSSSQRERLKAGLERCRETIMTMCHFMNIKIVKSPTSEMENFITNVEF